MRLLYNEIAMKILIVDDEEPIRELIKYNVEKQKYETFTAENGQQALELCRNKNPDLVILDLILPDMSGLDICRIIRNDSSIKNIPIIMVTAKTEDSDIVTGLELGADDYVTKPFSPKVLLARIQSVLRRKGEAFRSNSDEDIKIRSLVISPLKHKVTQNGKEVELSATEFSILEFLYFFLILIVKHHHKNILLMFVHMLLNIALQLQYIFQKELILLVLLILSHLLVLMEYNIIQSIL